MIRVFIRTKCLLILLLFFSCTEKSILVSINKPATLSSGVDFPDVKMYIDCSGSMRGFVVAESVPINEMNFAFKKIVPAICNKLIQNNKLKEIIQIKEKDKDEKTIDDISFLKSLANGKAFGGASSEIQDIIPKIIEGLKSNRNEVAMFVSDGVLSFGPEKVFSDRNYNLVHKSTLNSLIENALVKHPDISFAIIKYTSDFDGKYYYNCKEQAEYTGKILKKRPFYFFVIGNKDKVEAVINDKKLIDANEGILTSSNPKSMEAVLFRKSPSYEKGGINATFQVGKDGTNGKFKNDGTDKVFVLAIKASSLPKVNYLPDTYFNNLLCDEKYIKVEAVPSEIVFVAKGAKIFKSDYDLFYKIEVGKEILDKDSTTFSLYFPPTLDIKNTNIDEDYALEDISALEGKTWGFELISNAIEQSSRKAKASQITISMVDSQKRNITKKTNIKK